MILNFMKIAPFMFLRQVGFVLVRFRKGKVGFEFPVPKFNVDIGLRKKYSNPSRPDPNHFALGLKICNSGSAQFKYTQLTESHRCIQLVALVTSIHKSTGITTMIPKKEKSISVNDGYQLNSNRINSWKQNAEKINLNKLP